MKLSPAGRTAMWIGCGGFVGLAVGAFVTNPRQAISLSPFWIAGVAIFIGLVIGLARSPDAAARPAKGAKATAMKSAARAIATAPASPDALQIRFEYPDVRAGHPAVMGRGEPLHVKIIVEQSGVPSDTGGLRSALSAGTAVPAEGAAVQLSAAMDGETLTGDGLTGTGGEVEFTLEPTSSGELTLTAEAKAGPTVAHGSSVVSIVNYEEEIERLFGEFRGYAVGVLGPEAHADTARELCDKLRYRADPQTARALLELARVYELVAYGERTADRKLYLAVLEQLMVLEHAELPDSGGPVSREA